MAGELTTANYGWIKPVVDGSDDAWGGYINTDLDGIDTIVKGVSVVANAAYPASNPSGYQTAGQVASVVIGDNRIINGDMRIDQRNNGASGTATGYTADRWIYAASVANKGAWQRGGAGPGLLSLGFGYVWAFTSSSAYSSLAGDTFQLVQKIEADMVSDFAWGTVNAQPVTLAFWVTSTLSGAFSGAIRNDTSNRSYPFTYSIPVANAWTKIVITIPGDTAGTWVMSGSANAMYVMFDLGNGATARGPANAWASAGYAGATGTVSVVGTNGAVWQVTGVKLEIGSVATPYNRQSLAKSMADCQRYYQKIGGVNGQDVFITGYASGVMGLTTMIGIPYMRASPTITRAGTFTAANCSFNYVNCSNNTIVPVLTSTATGGASWYNADATAYLTANAEL